MLNALLIKAQAPLRSGYLRSIATLSAGQVAAAVMPLLAAPILGRLYEPGDYGALAAFMALSGIFGAIGTLQLEQAIIAERHDLRAAQLMTVLMILGGLVASISAFAALMILSASSVTMARLELDGWIFLLPFTVVATSVSASIAAMANRKERYQALAKIPATATGVTVGTSILFGSLGWHVDGLFASYFLGQATSLLAFLRLARKNSFWTAVPSGKRLFIVTWKHRRFALYTFPAQLVGIVSRDSPIYALSLAGSGAPLGAFNRARALVSMPLSLVGSAVAQVFRQRAAEDMRKTGSCRRAFIRTLVGLAALGIAPVIAIAAFGPQIFQIVLGPKWSQAGEMVQVLAPMLFLRLLCSPLSSVLSITGNQKMDFRLSIAGLVLCVVSVSLPIALGLDDLWVVGAFSFAYSVIYVVYLGVSWRLTG